MAFQASESALQAIRELRPVLVHLQKADAPLADQVRRAAQSLALNLDEGCWKAGRDRINRYRIAAGSGAEVRAALRVAEALGYLDETQIEPVVRLLNRVLAILWKIIDPLSR
jgi:four helix bundle protein